MPAVSAVVTQSGMRFVLILLVPMLAAWAGKEFRVLTSNIHHGEGMDGRIDLARIAKLIRQSRAGIVALQEVEQRTKRNGGVDALGTLEEMTKLGSRWFSRGGSMATRADSVDD